MSRYHDQTRRTVGSNHLVTATVKTGISDFIVVKRDITAAAGIMPLSKR